MSFENFLKLIQERDPVKAGVVNKPIRTIDQNVRYLWDVLQAAAIGSTVYLHRQTVEETVKVGSAVWLNPSTKQFEKGLATTLVDNLTGYVLTHPSSQVWGVVANKINATLADILLFGVDDIDISQATDTGTVEPGIYYLSGAAPGKLTQQKPPISVAVLRATGDGKIFVMPQFVDFLDRHTHYKFDLVCEPAGNVVPPGEGGRHVITDANVELPGWLPADHASFEGKAPAGAVFGYNFAAHPALKNAWPPLPISNAYFEWNKGTDANVGSTGVPLGLTGLAVFDRNGIWWMSDCEGDVPWPRDFENSDHSGSYSNSAGAECPRDLFMSLTLWFTKINFATDASMVLSLHSGDDRIKVKCFGTDDDASTGHLELFLDLDLTVEEDALGARVLKEFDPDTSKFKRGVVCEGVYKVSDNVIITSTVSRLLDPDDEDSPTLHQGAVGISVIPEPFRELEVQLVRLDGATEEHFEELMYLGFEPAEDNQYRAKLHIPSGSLVENPHLKLRFQIFSRGSGTVPQLIFTGRRVPRPPDGLNTPLDLPGTGDEFVITCDTQGVTTDNNQYIEAESEAFAVEAGDTIFFMVKRESTDGFGSQVGILRQVGVLQSGA